MTSSILRSSNLWHHKWKHIKLWSLEDYSSISICEDNGEAMHSVWLQYMPSKNISCFLFPQWYGEQLGQNKYSWLELTGQVQLKICFMQPKFYKRLFQAGHGVHSKACQNTETTQTSKRSYSNDLKKNSSSTSYHTLESCSSLLKWAVSSHQGENQPLKKRQAFEKREGSHVRKCFI